MIQNVNRICYTICITCIIAGVVFGLIVVWSDRQDRNQWKYLATIAILFFASLLTLSVNRFLDKGQPAGDKLP